MRRRELIIGGTAFAATRIVRAETSPNPRTIVTTELGKFTVEAFPQEAPITARWSKGWTR
jgi:hypothetical protein